MSKKIPLVEMFGPTIQGEGVQIGQQVYFLRFGGCDARCSMCDSWHAVEPNLIKQHATYLTQEEILQEFLKFRQPNSTNWIVLSGGNPCMHDLTELVQSLKAMDFKIAVETQGSIYQEWLLMADVITISPKGPGLDSLCTYDMEKLEHFVRQLLQDRYAHVLTFKTVIFDQRDLDFTVNLFTRFKEVFAPQCFYMSLGNMFPTAEGRPIEEVSYVRQISQLVGSYKILLQDITTHPILSQLRFLPQLHVFFYGNDKGV